MFSLRLEDITGAFTVEPVLATGSTSVNIRVTNGSLDYENPNQRKFIILVSHQGHLHLSFRISFSWTLLGYPVPFPEQRQFRARKSPNLVTEYNRNAGKQLNKKQKIFESKKRQLKAQFSLNFVSLLYAQRVRSEYITKRFQLTSLLSSLRTP